MEMRFLKVLSTKSFPSSCGLRLVTFYAILYPYEFAKSGIKIDKNVNQMCLRLCFSLMLLVFWGAFLPRILSCQGCDLYYSTRVSHRVNEG